MFLSEQLNADVKAIIDEGMRESFGRFERAHRLGSGTPRPPLPSITHGSRRYDHRPKWTTTYRFDLLDSGKTARFMVKARLRVLCHRTLSADRVRGFRHRTPSSTERSLVFSCFELTRF
jgi:hypothetical protein